MPESQRPRGGRRQREDSPEWPSLEQQLIESKVRHGSALEHLIGANQDFHILHSNEAKDGLPYPPWLRVHWRKAHPDMVYSPDDPSGGYPRVLERIYAFMVANQDLPAQDQATPEQK